jgi:hypothetical protein
MFKKKVVSRKNSMTLIINNKTLIIKISRRIKIHLKKIKIKLINKMKIKNKEEMKIMKS